METCPECHNEYKNKTGLGAHRYHKHGVLGKNRSVSPSRVPVKSDFSREKEIQSALIKAFRDGLKNMEVAYGLISKLEDRFAELALIARDLERENQSLHRENTALVQKVQNVRISRDRFRKEVNIVPLSERLTPEELAFLYKISQSK